MSGLSSIVQSIEDDKRNINQVLVLLKYLKSNNVHQHLDCVRASARVFERFLSDGDLHVVDRADKNRVKAFGWLRSVFNEVCEQMLRILSTPHNDGDARDGLQINVAIVRSLMSFVQIDSQQDQRVSGQYAFNFDLYHNLILTIVLRCQSHVSEQLLQLLLEFYVLKHSDLRYYCLRSIHRMCEEQLVKTAPQARNLLIRLLMKLPGQSLNETPTYFVSGSSQYIRDGITAVGCPKSHQKAFSEAWLDVMSLPMLNVDDYKVILKVLHEDIIPHMNDPRRLHDFLTDCYSNGDLILQILALNSLFHLIHKYNLDYPEFYTKLYALFNFDMVHSMYRSRFLKLADLFLKSSHLPVNLVAAFIKRMCRLCLSSPPAAILTMLAMVHNLMRRHPSTIVLIHRALSQVEEQKFCHNSQDPFDMHQQDPSMAGAMQSSLWELEALKSHYLPAVVNMARQFQKQFTTQQLELQESEYMDETYSTMLRAELTKQHSKPAPLNQIKSTKLFAYQS
ncbi:hypothetical protein MP228_013139 [Amoeboaphelidium protococcarum]|nr:hypothetical protein MP228_013139 [Amoeboaphelidium protococcarum]